MRRQADPDLSIEKFFNERKYSNGYTKYMKHDRKFTVSELEF